MKEQKGITLIALVITIIVMLILAGISLNAVIGDNGIITQAQNATYMQSVAVLEEFMQQQYIGDYQEIQNNDNRIDSIINLHPEYFYVPRNNGYGNLNYIESEGKSLFLIKKSGLPDDIKSQLKGGDAGDGSYMSYASLKDVYGVTEDLQIYYCSDGIESIIGLTIAEIDDIKERIVFEDTNTGLGGVLGSYDIDGDGKISSSEIRNIKKLEVTETADLSELYNLYSLEEIDFKDVSNINLKGIENCSKLSKIMFYNSSAAGYGEIGKLGEKLTHLYLVNTTNDNVSKLGTDLSSYDLPNLQYFGIWGSPSYEWGCGNFSATTRYYYGHRLSNVTDISGIESFSETTKKAIKYMFIQSNKITSLESLSDFTNLVYLRAYGNQIENLNGIQGMKNLTNLSLANNSLQDTNEKGEGNALYQISNCTSLSWLDISTNNSLIWISYLSNLPIEYLYMDGCSSISTTDIVSLKDKIIGCTDKTYDNKYTSYLIDTTNTTNISYKNQTIDIASLKNVGECTKLKVLDLTGTKVVKGATETLGQDENTVEKLMKNVFFKLTALQELSIDGLTVDIDGNGGNAAEKIKNLNFLNVTGGLNNKLRVLALKNTDVVALGDASSKLNTTDNEISKNNVEILNSLNALRYISINTDKFDLSKLVPMLNRFERYDTNFNGTLFQRDFGLLCFNETSLKTLEGCKEIEKIIIWCNYEALGTNDWVIDLSGCTNLTEFYAMRAKTGGKINIKLPASIKYIYTWYCEINYEYSTGTNLDYVVIDELENDEWGRIVSKLVSSNIKVKELNLRAINDDSNFTYFLDSSGKCNWLTKLDISARGWREWQSHTNIWKAINILKDSESLESLQIGNCNEENLGFLKEFTNLKRLAIVTQSKIKNISDIRNFVNLEELIIQNSYVTNIGDIGACTNLKSLYLQNNQISLGLNELSKLRNLSILNLSGNNFAIDEFINVGTGVVKDSFINIFKDLHVNGSLNSLYLSNTGLTGIYDKLNVSPSWSVLDVPK